MGVPMSLQLIKAGYPVTVHNRNTAKETALKEQGAATAVSPAQLIQQTDVVFVMVSDDAAAREVFTGSNGLLSSKTKGKIMINMSTVSPGISKELAALCREEGSEYLDAPVSGSVKQAEEGQLVIMVGGENNTFQQAKPILEKIGRLVILVGDSGAGNTAKLAINVLLGFTSLGLAESTIFARQHGIKTEDLINLINNSALGSVFIKIKGDAIIKDNYNAVFALKHIAKDLRLAKDEGLTTPLAQVTWQTFQEAEAKHGEEDIIAIIKQVDQQ